MALSTRSLLSVEFGTQFLRLFDAWSNWKTDGLLPSRADFDPLDHPKMLKDITLFDVQRDPMRFRIRLVGTAIVEAMGRDTTGSFVDELENAEQIAQRCEVLVASKRPYFTMHQPVGWIPDSSLTYTTLGLPLAGNGTDVDMILFLMKFHAAEDGAASRDAPAADA